MNKVKNKSFARTFMFGGLLLLAAIAGFLYEKHRVVARQTLIRSKFHGTLLDKPREVQPFTLTGIDGAPFNQKSLNSHWTMMFFGFTRCGFICPTTMSELSKMYRALEGEHASPMPRIVMVSIDPARDDLQHLKQYVKAFHPDFYGARGSEEMTRAMTKALGIAYAKVAKDPNAPAREDDIEHTGAIMLFNPDGQLAAFFTTPHQAKILVEDYHLMAHITQAGS